jgi:serine phosphatase RsbU (regulator of sigma subunit)
MFKGIKFKMTSAIISAVLTTASLLTVVSTLLVSYTLKLTVRSRAVEMSKILSEAITGRQRQLSLRGEMVTQDNDFLTNFAFREDERERLHKDLSERLLKMNACLGVVFELDGKLATSAQNKCNVDPQLLLSSVALKQARQSSATSSTIENLGGRLLLISVVPIKRYEVQTLGYLATGVPFDKLIFEQLKSAAGAEVFGVVDGVVRDGTSPIVGGQELLKPLTTSATSNELITVEGLLGPGGTPLLAWAVPLKAGDKPQGALVFALSGKDASTLQRKLLSASLGFTILFTLLSGVLGLIIAGRVSRPIVEIEYSFREIAASGDLSRRITEGYSDEVGQMATSFNLMQEQIERLHVRVVEAERRMHNELMMASSVQEMLFPATTIDGARCQFASHSQTSSETGGDWCTIIHAPDVHNTTAIVSDVTGHGAAAALVTAILHGFFKATQDEITRLPASHWREGIESVLKRLNNTIIESTRGSLVSSLFLFSFDHKTLRAQYVNAGHLAPLIASPEGKGSKVGILASPPSVLLGDMANPFFSWGEIQFQPGQLFLLYTDGLIECTNAQQEMYGFRRLRAVLSGVYREDARTVRDRVLSEAKTFFGDHPPNDDITIIVGRTR